MKRANHKEGKPLDAYDMIIIGTGEKGKSTVNQLNEQGQEVMYIELSPEMITTMICHHPAKNDSTSNHDHETDDDESIDSKIQLQKQSIHTPAGETITYTFHITETQKEEVEIPEETEIPKKMSEQIRFETPPNIYTEFTVPETAYTPESENTFPYLSWPENIEHVELNDSLNNTSSATNSFDTQELLTDFNSDALKFTKSEDTEDIEDVEAVEEVEEVETVELDPISDQSEETSHDYFSLIKEDPKETTEHIHLEEEEPTKQSGEEFSLDLLRKLKPSSLSRQQAQEISIREQFLTQKKNSSTTNLFSNFAQQAIPKNQSSTKNTSIHPSSESSSPNNSIQHTTPIPMKQQTKMDHSSFLDSVLNKPVYSPKESRLRKRPNHKAKKQINPVSPSHEETQKLIPSSQTPLQANQMTNHSPTTQKSSEEQPKISSLEPFSTRRRARVQKKNRILSTVERFQSNQSSTIDTEDQPILQKQTQPTFSEPQPKQDHYEEEIHTSSLEIIDHTQENDSLKRDNIEFEEPYGYNSWEEFMYPSAQNNRKRQEMDKIKKRKIALRGLHNLINNLG